MPNHAGRIAALVLALLAVAGSCGPRTPVEKAGRDQEIAKDVQWELRKDARFAQVNPFCVDHVVTLEGRVSTQAEEAEAVRIANLRSRGAPVRSRLEVRPR